MNGTHLKFAAITLMALEHGGLLLSRLLGNQDVDLYVHYLGRLVFPIFVFLMVEGFFKTSNREKYLKRVFLWAVIMSIGSLIVVYLSSILLKIEMGSLFRSPELLFRLLAPVGRNIFWSLGIGLLLLYIIELIRNTNGINRIMLIGLALLVSVFSLITEASFRVVPLFLIFYFFYHRPKLMIVFYGLFSLAFLIKGLMNMQSLWTFEYQWIMILALPFFISYNGKTGNRRHKYFFYIFYPAHLWIIFIIEAIFLR